MLIIDMISFVLQLTLRYRFIMRMYQPKDLGLTISVEMKISEQRGIAAAKGNQIHGLIRRNIVYNIK